MTRSDMNSDSTTSVVVPLAAFVVESADYASSLPVNPAVAVVCRLHERMVRSLASDPTSEHSFHIPNPAENRCARTSRRLLTEGKTLLTP